MKTTIEEILENFEFLEEWDDRYQYVIELGKELDRFPDELKVEENKVRGCVSQVWLTTQSSIDSDGVNRLKFKGDSDALIVKGLVGIMLSLYNGRTAQEIVNLDVESVLGKMGLRDHLVPQRSNGLSAMVDRIRQEARNSMV